MQGGVEYAHDKGTSLSLWTTNIAEESDKGQEIDITLGQEMNLGPDWTLVVKAIHYRYFLDSNSDYFEGQFGVSFKQLSLNVFYAPKMYVSRDESYKNTYVNLAYTHPIEKDLNLSIALGHSFYNHEKLAGTKDYTDYLVTLAKTVGNVTIGVNYADTFGYKTYAQDAQTQEESWNKSSNHNFFVNAGIQF